MPSALAIIPHPDDESYSFAGTLALLAKWGWRCRVVCATKGEGGERHDGGPAGPDAVGAARESELRRSCEELGAGYGGCWGLPDGGVRARDAEPLVREALEAEPFDLLFSLGRDGAYGHPDHLELHSAIARVWASSRRSGRLLFAAFPPGLFAPQYEKCVASGIMGKPPRLRADEVGTDARHYETDIARVAQVKLAAIAAHRTQLPDGDPRGLFPPGLVDALLGSERFLDASGQADQAMNALFTSL